MQRDFTCNATAITRFLRPVKRKKFETFKHICLIKWPIYNKTFEWNVESSKWRNSGHAVWQTENINMKFCLFYISYKTDLAKSLIFGRYFVSVVLIIDVKFFFFC